MSYAPPTVVEGVARQPLPGGLLSVLTPRGGADAHWQNGIEWETLGCAPVSGIGDPSCDPEEPTTGLPKQFQDSGDLGEASPFTVYGSYKCNPVGHTIEYAQDRATEHLLAREEARVEQAIWTGDLDNQGFAEGAVNAGSAAVSVRRAIAQLEGWIGRNYGSLGVIHMTREAAFIAAAGDELTLKNGKLYTSLGTPVVAGAGYPGTGPTGQSPAGGQTYMYATPALVGYRSEVFPGSTPPSAGLDRSKNDLYAVAERTYVVGWDPCGTAYAIASF